MPTTSAPSDDPVPGSSSDPRHRLGARGEDAAAEFLAARGHAVLARNWRLAAGELRGELDLVTRAPDGMLVVVEVKTRRGSGYGGALASVTPRKQARIRSLAAAFLQQTRLRAGRVRFDVIAVDVSRGQPRIQHLPDAF